MEIQKYKTKIQKYKTIIQKYKDNYTDHMLPLGWGVSIHRFLSENTNSEMEIQKYKTKIQKYKAKIQKYKTIIKKYKYNYTDRMLPLGNQFTFS